jgi:hypothetical protein
MEQASERSRREFLSDMGLLAGGAAALAAGVQLGSRGRSADLIVVSGEDPAMVKKAIEEMGSMKKFVSRATSVIKQYSLVRAPNGGNTNPAVGWA